MTSIPVERATVAGVLLGLLLRKHLKPGTVARHAEVPATSLNAFLRGTRDLKREYLRSVLRVLEMSLQDFETLVAEYEKARTSDSFNIRRSVIAQDVCARGTAATP